MNTKQPMMLSKEEWEVIGEACGFIHKTYEKYREWKQKRVKWEPGMLAWDVFEKKMCVWEKEYDTIPYSSIVWHPPTKDQLDEYERNQENNKFPNSESTMQTEQPKESEAQFMIRTHIEEYHTDPAISASPVGAAQDIPSESDSEGDPKSITPEKDPVREIGSSAMWDGRHAGDRRAGGSTIVIIESWNGETKRYKIASKNELMLMQMNATLWINANQLSDLPEEESDPANTYSPSPATQAQIAKYYTVKIDGVRYRFYSKRISNGMTYRVEGFSDIRIMSSLAANLIKRHNYPVLSVDDMGEMIPPTKGESK